MEISWRVECTPTEARQLAGAPDLLPLYECCGAALEDCLVALVARLEPPAPPPGAVAGPGDDRRGQPER